MFTRLGSVQLSSSERATMASLTSPGVGQAVERLVEAEAGVLGAHHVAQRVAAGRSGGEAEPVEPGQHLGHVAVLDPVQLDVLPGGEVQPVGAVAAGQPGQAPRLVGWAARRPGRAPAS